MDYEYIINIVEKINDLLENQITDEKDEEYIPQLILSSCGHKMFVIELFNFVLWDSENFSHFDEEGEGTLEEFLIEKINNVIRIILKMKLYNKTPIQ